MKRILTNPVWKLIGIASMTMMAGAAVLGVALLVAALMVDAATIALEAATVSISATLAIGFLIWLKSKYRSPMVLSQNIVAGCWIIASSMAVAYILLVVPSDVAKAIASTTGIEMILWLLLYHITRKLYRKGRQINIASSSGKSIEDPDVINYANNSDLATSIFVAMMFATKSIIIMQSDFVPYITPAAIRLIGITLGSSVGIILFNFCPNQTNIREFISRSRGTED